MASVARINFGKAPAYPVGTHSLLLIGTFRLCRRTKPAVGGETCNPTLHRPVTAVGTSFSFHQNPLQLRPLHIVRMPLGSPHTGSPQHFRATGACAGLSRFPVIHPAIPLPYLALPHPTEPTVRYSPSSLIVLVLRCAHQQGFGL